MSSKAILPRRPHEGTCGSFSHIWIPTANRNAWFSAISDLAPTEITPSGWQWFQLKACTAAADFLPQEVRLTLREFSRTSSIDTFVLDNLPFVEPGPPPDDRTRPATKPFLHDAVLAGTVGQTLCESFTYKQEDPNLHQEVAPALGQENTASNFSRRSLPWHNDGACFEFELQPYLLAFLGLLNDEDVPTLLLNLDEDILPAISFRLLSELMRPQFIFPVPASLNFGSCEVRVHDRPILFQDRHGVFHVNLPSRDCEQATLEAQEALSEFRELLCGLTARHVVVGPRRLLVFKNTRNLHSRPNVTGKRWFTRTYAAKSLDLHRVATSTSSSEPNSFDARLLLM